MNMFPHVKIIVYINKIWDSSANKVAVTLTKEKINGKVQQTP